ncbi:MAG: hypothetical protein NC212_03570 [Staphylococcus sp.]|nr:hypothetical protein [Staphylococcus sp.]
MFIPNPIIFEEACRAWRQAEPLRAKRRRLMTHTYGDQWGDPVVTAEGRIVSEYDKAVMSGLKPMTNNLLRALVKSVVGRFRFNISQSETPGAPLADIRTANALPELDSRALEEYLISGCVIQKVVSERRPVGGLGVWVDNVRPDSFFCNRFLDPRGSDIRILGMVHDMPPEELKLRFGHGSRRRCARLERACRELRSRLMRSPLGDLTRPNTLDSFLKPAIEGCERVIV